jgi:hypothetical protein
MIVPLLKVPVSLGSAAVTRADPARFKAVQATSPGQVSFIRPGRASVQERHTRPATVTGSSMKYDIGLQIPKNAPGVRVLHPSRQEHLPPGVVNGLGRENEAWGNQEFNFPSHLGEASPSLGAGVAIVGVALGLLWFLKTR